jgi:hypothetical protein
VRLKQHCEPTKVAVVTGSAVSAGRWICQQNAFCCQMPAIYKINAYSEELLETCILFFFTPDIGYYWIGLIKALCYKPESRRFDSR